MELVEGGAENMKSKAVIALVLMAAVFTSCKRTSSVPLHVIYVIDLTASTNDEARAKAFEGVKESFDKGLLRRGDSITVIPITGDALIESQGAILRFEISTNREAYDEDLQRLRDDVVDKLQKMQEKAAANPYLSSDILGAVRIVGEEFSTDKPGVRRLLVILSDCVQDVKQLNFKSASIVANKNNASRAAKEMASTEGKLFNAADVYVGLLRSTDLKRMSPKRREALETFWTEYFKQAGAKSVHVSSDGPGQLAKFIAE
jgi:hypothetical protein